jgi:hypothetical protein
MSDMVTGALLTLVGALIGHFVTIGLARANRKETLRLAAVEKRLAAHQEGYAHWCRLLLHLHDQKLHDTVRECQLWWQNNCLYLDPKSREEFWNGTFDAANFQVIKGQGDPRETFQRLRHVLTTLVDGVGLPTLGEHEWSTTLASQ